MDTMVRDEVAKLDSKRVMSDFEFSVELDITQWAVSNNKRFATSEDMIKAYWEQYLA